MSGGRWQIWIDRGGTFTDCVGVDPGGALGVVKLLSSDDAPIEGIRRLLGLAAGEAIPACEVRMGTTIATNALLERKGAPTGLAITRGFGDLLAIGDQARPELFALAIERPTPLPMGTVEVAGRIGADGREVAPLDVEEAEAGLRRLRAGGARSLAVVLIHAYLDGRGEAAIAAAARAAGFEHVSCSHEVAGSLGMLSRAETTVVDAYLTPLLGAYVRRVVAALGGARLRLMQSSGDLTEAARFRGRDAIVSGPAGGVVAEAAIGQRLGLGAVIGFDMGGTSTDVCRWAGEATRSYESMVAGVRVRTPMMAVHTVAAGGGSCCRYAEGRFTVGPESAGARPGPLCYGDPSARELTLTDVNLALGRLAGDRFPFALDGGRVAAHLEGIAAALAEQGDRRGPEAIAAGFFAVAVEGMAAAIRTISVARGHDPRSHALVVFGGAGGQHACAVARALGVRTLVFHPLAGVLSAFGMGVARVGWHGEADGGRVALGEGALAALGPILGRLEAEGRARLATDEGVLGAVEVRRRVDLRYRGSEGALTLALAEGEDEGGLRGRFEAAHRRELGWTRPGHVVEVVSARVEVREAEEADAPGGAGVDEAVNEGDDGDRSDGPCPIRHTVMWAEGRAFAAVPVLRREELRAGARVAGPALILEATATIALDPGWVAVARADGVLVASDGAGAGGGGEAAGSGEGEVAGAGDGEGARGARRRDEEGPGAEAGGEGAVERGARRREEEGPGVVSGEAREGAEERGAAADPALLEILGNRFMAIAEQMGAVLRRTALSTNIRERLDFSCAVFDEAGELVSNAPHIPVHLGAMSESIRGVLRAHPRPGPGEVFVTNDPAAGGSHLPDITVVAPIHDGAGRLRFFTACRGHHADVGGITPGSMPPHSTSLAEEGVVFRAVPALREGALDREGLLEILSSGTWPARRPLENLADLEAQIAACHAGGRLLAELCEAYGAATVSAYMGHVQAQAAAAVAAAIAALPAGTRRFADALDDGTPVVVTLTREGGRLIVDFAGTGAEVAGNLNAPRAVTVAAVLYVLRLWAGRSIPLNSGCLRAVDLRIPRGSLLDPSPGRAVVAGNVETSQRVVDVLLGALGLAAASQGTMNNLTFGDDSFGYYETLGGGAGATATAAGASGVHTHMTNTRLTDPEVLEARFPVRLRELSLRRGSGGAGRRRGGDGLCREIEALRPLRVSILGERRLRAPFGLDGGEPGACARDLLNGRVLAAKSTVMVAAGDRVRIETPGGGGFGAADEAAGAGER